MANIDVDHANSKIRYNKMSDDIEKNVENVISNHILEISDI